MIKNIYQRLELHFWDWFTPRMSESAGLRYLMQQVYSLTHENSTALLFLSLLTAAVAGLILGWIMGSFGIRVW